MKQSKIFDFIGTLLLLIGFILAFLPHAFHTSIGLNNGTAHTKHVATGIILVLLALTILIYNNRKYYITITLSDSKAKKKI